MHPCPWFIVRSIGIALASVSLLGLSACRRQTDRSAGTQTTQRPQTGQVEQAASRPPSVAEGPSTARPGNDGTPNQRVLGAVPSLAPLVQQVRAAAVNISSRFRPRLAGGARPAPAYPWFGGQRDQSEEDPMQRFLRFFGGPELRPPEASEVRGLGTGIYIGDGLVLTNNHVVEVQDPGSPDFRPMDDIKVKTDETSPDGGREYSAKVIGNDPKTDLALLRIEGKHVNELKAAVLGDSDALQVGDHVVAIGEPFGLEATVTAGIVSAKERTLSPDTAYSDFLQTDASINPGNSGGPLFDLKGQVVGVNTAIISGANTIGFAVPSSIAKQILPQLRDKGRVVRAYLGVSLQPITQDMAEQLGLDSTQGALVADVEKDGPAAKAGVQPGDVIVKLDGKPIHDSLQLTRDIGARQPGADVILDAVRDHKHREIKLKLTERPDEREVAARSRRMPGRSGRRPER